MSVDTAMNETYTGPRWDSTEVQGRGRRYWFKSSDHAKQFHDFKTASGFRSLHDKGRDSVWVAHGKKSANPTYDRARLGMDTAESVDRLLSKIGEHLDSKTESFLDDIEKHTGPLKPGRNHIAGHPVDIGDQNPEEGLHMRGVDRDAAQGAMKHLRSKGFKVSRLDNHEFTVLNPKNESVELSSGDLHASHDPLIPLLRSSQDRWDKVLPSILNAVYELRDTVVGDQFAAVMRRIRQPQAAVAEADDKQRTVKRGKDYYPLHHRGTLLSHPLKAYHPEMQKSYNAMQSLENGPWTPESEAQWQKHAAIVDQHVEFGIHPKGDGSDTFGAALFPKKLPNKK